MSFSVSPSRRIWSWATGNGSPASSSLAEILLARDRIASCPCAHGCPSCVGPVQEVGSHAKAIALRCLDLLLPRLAPQGAPIPAVDEPEPVPRDAPEAFRAWRARRRNVAQVGPTKGENVLVEG